MATSNEPTYTSNYGENNPAKGRNRARVGGSGFTVFSWEAQPLLYAKQVSHVSPAPVQGVVPIHPMDTPYPTELVTPMAATMGTITMEFYDLYGSTIWERLGGLVGESPLKGGPVDIVGLFKAVANEASPITIFKFVRAPSLNGKQFRTYTEEYHNCVISQVANGETIEVGTMEILKQITVNYTHVTIEGENPVLTKSNLGSANVNYNYVANGTNEQTFV